MIKTADSIKVTNFLEKNASEYHEIGATIFAEAVVKNNSEMLLKSISYLEKACACEPENRGMTVDLADAYMQVDSPTLTALAIELYESVFSSFSDDSVVARIVNGYEQLGNYEAAYAFAENRMEYCPPEARQSAAKQMSVVALLSNKELDAESVILADIVKRGDDPLLQLTIVALRQGKGDKTGALKIINNILRREDINSPIHIYANHLKAEVTNEQ